MTPPERFEIAIYAVADLELTAGMKAHHTHRTPTSTPFTPGAI